MNISDILRHKSSHTGAEVITIAPSGSVSEMLTLLTRHRIGALVVVNGDTVTGIVSERDVVRQLNDQGAALLQATVAEIMTSPVVTSAPDDDVDSIATTMTDRRIRHMPVLEGGRLVGLVSIGDVVSSRIRQLEQDRGQLEQYITG